MTICVSVRIAEGLILAADSMVTIEGTINTPKGPKEGVLQTFEFANKLTRIKDYPIGVMTWGVASISDRSIPSLIMEWEYGLNLRMLNAGFTVKDMADELQGFIGERYDKSYPDTKKRPRLGVFIGGYSDGRFFSEEFFCEWPNKIAWKKVRPDKADGSPDFGANWFGQVDALNRLIHGYDKSGINELIKRGVEKEIVEKWIGDRVSEMQLVFDGMPIQDAVEFANYAVEVTIGRFRFSIGVPVCGGNVDIAVITPESFQWAQRKQWAIKQ